MACSSRCCGLSSVVYHGWEGKCSEILATPSYSKKNPRVNKDICYDMIWYDMIWYDMIWTSNLQCVINQLWCVLRDFLLFQVFPYHSNVNASLSCKFSTQRILTPRDLNWVQHWVSRIGLFFSVPIWRDVLGFCIWLECTWQSMPFECEECLPSNKQYPPQVTSFNILGVFNHNLAWYSQLWCSQSLPESHAIENILKFTSRP